MRNKIPNKIRNKTTLYDAVDTPSVEVFGSALALFIIIFILVNLIVTNDIQTMLDRSIDNAKYKISWNNQGSGYIVIAYPDKLKIVETKETIASEKVCSPGSSFINYATQLYNVQNQQLIFAITDGGVQTMADARNCIRQLWPNRLVSIGWIIANKDLLSTVDLEQLPARIKKTIETDQR